MTARPLLVLIDLQNDFLAAPRLEPHPDTILAGTARLLDEFRRRGLPVAHVRTQMAADGKGRMPHWEETNHFFCVEGTSGWASPALLEPRADEPVFYKSWFSAFTSQDFEDYLRDQGTTTIVLAGLHLQTCLRQTALDGYQKGFRVFLARDASGSHDPLHGALTLDYLAERGMKPLDTTALLKWLETVEVSLPQELPSLEGLIPSLRAAQSEWARAPMSRRIEILRCLAAGLQSEKENLARVIVEQVRKPITFARGEVDRAIALLKVVTARAETFQWVRTEAEGQVHYHPRGIVAMITPWNNPLAIPMGKLAPALVFGNAVVWKPSPYAPRVAHAITPLLEQAGVPRNLVEIVEGDDRCARKVIASGVDAIAFSGSSRTGWSIVAQAASRLLPVQAELGGNNGAIVSACANLKAAADAIAEGAFGFAGQRCTSNRRAIVLAEIYDSFLSQIEASTRELPSGDPWKIETRVTPMISPEAARTVAGLVERARAAGLHVIQPKAVFPDESFYPPTIILCDDSESTIVQEESFGPILVIQKARDFTHALELLNGVRYGLVAALFSQDQVEQKTFLQTAQAGIVKLNASTVNAGVDLPFTGWKQSGHGAAEHGEANAEFFTKRQAVYP